METTFTDSLRYIQAVTNDLIWIQVVISAHFLHSVSISTNKDLAANSAGYSSYSIVEPC